MRSLTIGQTAEWLGVSVATVRRLADCGQLPCHRLPSGYRRFDPSDVLDFARSLRQRRRDA